MHSYSCNEPLLLLPLEERGVASQGLNGENANIMEESQVDSPGMEGQDDQCEPRDKESRGQEGPDVLSEPRDSDSPGLVGVDDQSEYF